MYICKPSKAKTASEKMVKIITSLRFFTDSISAPTMVLRPGKEKRREKNGEELLDMNMNVTLLASVVNYSGSSSIFMRRFLKEKRSDISLPFKQFMLITSGNISNVSKRKLG